jgi:aldehyde:ferredoxin oxidoreductase
MDMPGYAGQILYVDLTGGAFASKPMDPETAHQFLGGWGINAVLASALIPAGADPLSAENVIIIGTGPFSGTLIPGSAELSVTTKLPLTGGIGTSCGGGHFPLMLKSSGFDHLVIYGKAAAPTYLLIENDHVRLCDATDLWGLDTYGTVDALRLRHEPCSVIPIGPSGENQVKISMTFIDKGGTLGYGGMPAVMGAKNLKAIVVCLGEKGIRVADRMRLQKSVNKMLDRIMDYRMRPVLIEGGTFAMTSQWIAGMGLSINGWDEIHKKSRKTLACPSCPMGDKELNRIREGEYAPMVSYMTDFMGEFESSADNPLDNHNRAVKRLDTLNRYGICRLNFNNVMGLMASLYAQGTLTAKDTGGIEIKHDFETTLRLIEMTAKKEGIGAVMAEGPFRAAEIIGGPAPGLAVHIKKCAPFIDPRADSLNTMALAQLVHPGRPNYACGGTGIYMPGRPVGQFIQHAHRMGMEEKDIARIFSSDTLNVGRLTPHAENWYSLFNAFGQCHRLYIHRFFGVENFCDFYAAVTGITKSPLDLLKDGERIWNLYKMLNVKIGFDRKQDEPPPAWFEPANMGKEQIRMMDYYKTKSIARHDLEIILDEYYDERGWDIKTGIPTTETLRRLDLENVFDES